MKIMTLNANGIRSAASKGFFEWMLKQRPDVVIAGSLGHDTNPFKKPKSKHATGIPILALGVPSSPALCAVTQVSLCRSSGDAGNDDRGHVRMADSDFGVALRSWRVERY